MRFKDPSEESPHVPPFVLVIQQNGFHFVFIIHRFVIRGVLRLSVLDFRPQSLFILTLVWPEGAPVRALPGL